MNTDRLKVKALTLDDNPEWMEGYVWQSSNIENTLIVGPGGVAAVNPDTLCQCTGLEDSNDDLIYEGDLLQLGPSVTIKVYWSLNHWVFIETKESYLARDIHTITDPIWPTIADLHEMTLTGKNIHDINQ